MVNEEPSPYRRRRKPLGGIFDDDFFNSTFGGDFLDRMEDITRRMMEDMNTSHEAPSKKYVYGFQMRTGPDGKPVVEEFGNIPKGHELSSDEREPLVDVIDGKEEVTVIAELPGVNKEDIDLKSGEKSLTIKVDTDNRRYFKELELPAKIKPDSVKASYKNGILEVKLKRAEQLKDEKKKIRVD